MTSPTLDSGLTMDSSLTLDAQSTVPGASTMRVQAVYDGVYGGVFYQAGDIFDITILSGATLDSNITMDSNVTLDGQSSSAFSDNSVNYGPNSGTIQLGWMMQVPSSTPLYQLSQTGVWSMAPQYPVSDGNRRLVY